MTSHQLSQLLALTSVRQMSNTNISEKLKIIVNYVICIVHTYIHTKNQYIKLYIKHAASNFNLFERQGGGAPTKSYSSRGGEARRFPNFPRSNHQISSYVG